MLVRIRRNGNNKTEFTKNHFKQRLIFLERIVDNTIKTFNNTKDKMIYRVDREAIPSNKSYVVILNHSKKYQNNPDNFLIEEEVHTFNTYYGIIYKEPSLKLSVKDLDLENIIFIEDYNFNIIYNQLNRSSTFFENYNRYQSYSIFGNDMYRTTVDSIQEKIDAPNPKYYTLEEQKHADESLDTMKERVLNNYKNHLNAPLLALSLRELADNNTRVAHLNITMNSIDIIVDDEIKDKLKKDIYYLVSSIKYDMELWGISKIVGLMTSDKGFNFYQINTLIQMNPQLTQSCVRMFLECFQNRYDEIFKSMVFYLEGMHDLSLYFSLAPIENIIEISVQKFSKNKLEMIQQDIHDQLINTIF